MEFNVFKKSVNANGRSFDKYFTRLKKKDGTQVTCQVIFQKDCRIPSEFPCVLVANKDQLSYTEKTRTVDEKTYHMNNLYVRDYEEVKEYIDTSMDVFC